MAAKFCSHNVKLWGHRTSVTAFRATSQNLRAFHGSGRPLHPIHSVHPKQKLSAWTKLISHHARQGLAREALRLYKKMQHEGFTPQPQTFVAALKACIAIPDLAAGKEVHAQVIKHGDQANIFVANTLVHMYAKCGSMEEARQVFGQMPCHDVASWNTMIMGHAQMDEGLLALQLYARMQHEGFVPSARTFVAALKACSSLALQKEGKQADGGLLRTGYLEKVKSIHSELATKRLEENIFVANTLIDVYVKCGSLVDACQVFENMAHPDAVSWTSIIMGYAQMEMEEVALQLYARMRDEGFLPSSRTFVAALKACGNLAAKKEGKQVDGEVVKVQSLEKGKIIHSEAAKCGFEVDNFVANSLVDMYAKCGSMVDANQVFERMLHPDVVSWTAMITGYAQMEKGELALQLYTHMQDKGIRPNGHTFVAALKACGTLAAREEGKRVDDEIVKIGCLKMGRTIHFQVNVSGFDTDIFVANTLIDMYSKCGSMGEAYQVFEKMLHQDVVSWTAMIMGYAQIGKGKVGLQLYARMQSEGFTPNAHTFIAALKACDSLAVQEEGRQVDGKLVKVGCLEKVRAIHSQIERTLLQIDLFVANTLIATYARCGSMKDAFKVFETMPHHDVVSWTAIIMGYAHMEQGDLALQLYANMQHEGFKPDACTFVAALKACGSLAVQEENRQVGEAFKIWCLEKGRALHSQIAKAGFESVTFVANTLMDMYAKCGSMVDACRVFERMGNHDLVSWNTMIMGYAQREEGKLALQMYARMQREDFTPDAYTFVPVLKACSSVPCLETGKEIHADICRAGLGNETFVANCLVDMYSKCGSMVDAQQLFDRSPFRDVVTWSALIAGYSSQGDSELAFDLFEKMQQEGIQPVGITFLSVLSVCGHTGMVDKGQTYFQDMCSRFRITPCRGHYSCMIDLLGRAGQLDEALAIVKKTPFISYTVTWMTILGACRMWNNAEVGRHAFDCIVNLDEKHAAAYVLMTNIYASAQIWKGSAEIQEMKINAQASMQPGECSWTDSTGRCSHICNE